jgi:hypothetical protein
MQVGMQAACSIPGGTQATWLKIGSTKPDAIEVPMHPRNTIWLRAKLMALCLREAMKQTAANLDYHAHQGRGLIISMEYPTPMNDYLVALNRIIHLTFFEDFELAEYFSTIRILYTNAASLRSIMKLTKKGAKNKLENIQKAYEFVDRAKYPELDTDSCDAVLLAMMGRNVASIMLGCHGEVPENFLTPLCNATQEMKGNGRNAHIVTKGILHRNEYWYVYERRQYEVCVKDASNPRKSLSRITFSI